ncbi:hypothetical protein AMS68_000955 [Peltaster fructicola]|uniref:Uncharacterized protein n=1 Tax=Peltaster fructicola TaxID=286661 RepID=A0A6H0XLD5_9PEZI|nr:hypothetical protein AMS68_000955 [Peltaster fructicola]
MWKRLRIAADMCMDGLGLHRLGGDSQNRTASQSYDQDAQSATVRTETCPEQDTYRTMIINELETILRAIIELRAAMDQRQRLRSPSGDLRRAAMNNSGLRRLSRYIVANGLYNGAAELVIELSEAAMIDNIPTLGQLALQIETKLGAGTTAATFDTGH